MKFLGSAMLAMMAGSQAVHLYFKPLDDLPAYIEREREHKGKSQKHQLRVKIQLNFVYYPIGFV